MLLTEYLCQQVRLLMLIRSDIESMEILKDASLPKLFMALVVLMVLSW